MGPPGRLRVRWDDAETWLAKKQRWEALQAATDETERRRMDRSGWSDRQSSLEWVHEHQTAVMRNPMGSDTTGPWPPLGTRSA